MACLMLIADETRGSGLRTTPTISRDFVRDTITDGWPSPAVGEGRDMQEELRATAIRNNEAEASVVLPFAHSPLEAHAFLAL